jgi:hypothetical protein
MLGSIFIQVMVSCYVTQTFMPNNYVLKLSRFEVSRALTPFAF